MNCCFIHFFGGGIIQLFILTWLSHLGFVWGGGEGSFYFILSGLSHFDDHDGSDDHDVVDDDDDDKDDDEGFE